ncbi:MAG TPA: hypothetical protein VGO80_15340 [Solirubrobacteraceae bacterium]|nr:hypothetical protein [Solirubrobacteraceae bacterium]
MTSRVDEQLVDGDEAVASDGLGYPGAGHLGRQPPAQRTRARGLERRQLGHAAGRARQRAHDVRDVRGVRARTTSAASA